MKLYHLAALCAAFLTSINAVAMSHLSFNLYEGALEFQCAQESDHIKVTAKSSHQFAAKIKANTSTGNRMSYGFSGGGIMNLGFRSSDLPIEFEIINEKQGTEYFTLDFGCQINT